MDKKLVRVDEEIPFNEIKKEHTTKSEWIKKDNVQKYERKVGLGFDKLIIIKTDNSPITYTLDSRSDLSYEIMIGHIVTVKGNVYDRQPLKL